MYGFLLAGILVTMYGCTIEKRLYNNGWHVASARHWKRTTADPKTIATAEAEPFAASLEKTQEKPQEAAGNVLPVQNMLKADVSSSETVTAGTMRNAFIKQRTNSEQRSTVQKKRSISKPRPWSRKAKTGTSIGLAVLLLVAVGLAIACFAVPAIAVSDMLALFFFGVVLSVAALIALIALIIVLCIPSDEQLARRAEKRRSAEKELEKASEEEREQLEKKRSGRMRNKKAALVFTVVVLFFLAIALSS